MDKKLFFTLRILSAIGITLALYLLWEQLFHPTFQPCNINAIVNCDAIISGAVAKTLGLPTPLYGLIGYIIIFLAATFRKKKLLLGMATFGLLFCLWIAYKEIVQLHVICPVCIMCDIVIVTTFTLAVILNKRQEKKAV
jgi:uncharacterized membrane protein